MKYKYVLKKIIPFIITSSLIMWGVMLPYTVLYNDNEQVLSKQGSTGDEVTKIQSKLKSLGFYTGEIDGKFGVNTSAAVRKFQQHHGLKADGVAGTQTLAALGIYSVSSSAVYKIGSTGDMVRQIQIKLISQGYLTGNADGVYGNRTAIAVRAFQSANNVKSDGVVGTETLALLGLSGTSSPPSTGNYDADIELLARIINAESRGEPYLGQVAVGAVVLNRVRHPSFPNTISGVIYQQGAFSSLIDGEFYKPIEESCYRAARDAMNGTDPSGGAIYFYNPAKTSNKWILSRQVINRIGGHVFAV
jgi:spore cortex-lytic enzyme